MVKNNKDGTWSAKDINGKEVKLAVSEVLNLSLYYNRACHENDIRTMLEDMAEDGEIDINNFAPSVIEDMVDRYEDYLDNAEDEYWHSCAENAIMASIEAEKAKRYTIEEKFENKDKDKPFTKDER